MALTLGSRIGVYEITAPIGEGGMGQVYRATDTTLGRQVAIKILPDAFASDPERLARFEREAKTLASLNHPHIAAIYGFEKSAGMHALVMELVEGEDLSQRIGRGAIPLDEALPIAKQIADALEAAHEQGFIHRDLKPANIKVRSDGTVKVLDFGLAKAMEPEAGSSPSVSMSPTITTPAMTHSGMILGTAAYMSPEQAKGRTVDKRSDVWSFGAVLYEMLTGRRAFEAEDVSETLAAVLMKEPDWAALPGNTPWNIRRLLRRCCERDPRRRMRDMGDVALELVDVAPEPFGEAEERRGIRWQMAGPVVFLLVLFAYFGGAWRSTPSIGATTEWIGERLGGPTVASFPVLSPDGTLLAFTAMDRGLNQIGVMQPGGTGGSRQLTHDRTRGYASLSAWSADSSRIYFHRTGRDGTNIYSISVVGDDDERLVLEDATTPRPLTDGSLLAVRTNSERLPQLIRFRPSINKLETLPVLLVDTLHDQAVKVLPGARQVLVAGRPQGTPASENHLHLVDPDTGDMRRIAPDFALPLFEFEFPLAATEDEVYFNVRAGDLYRIVAVKLDGSPGVRTVVSLSRRPFGIDVAGDGTLYLDQIETPIEILRIDAATSNVEHFPLSADFDYVLPLPNDSFLVARFGGSRPRLLRVTPPGAPTPFLDTDEEARGPLALIGDSLVAFAIGTVKDQQVALASMDGRLQRRIPIRNEGEVTGLAASPDGASLYYAVDNVVYRVPVVGGESRPVSRGQAVAVDPSTGHLVILRRGDVAEVVRVPAAGGTETSLAVTGDWRVYGLGAVNLTGNAIASDGRLLIRTLSPASWIFPVGILDGRRGGQVMPFLDPLDTDMLAAVWDRAGRVVALARPFRSELWSFRPMSAP